MAQAVLVQVQFWAPNKKRKLFSFLFLFGLFSIELKHVLVLVSLPRQKSPREVFDFERSTFRDKFCSSEFGAAVLGTIPFEVLEMKNFTTFIFRNRL